MRVTATIRRKGKIISRVAVEGEDGSTEAIKQAGEEAQRQAKAHDVAIRSRRQAYRRKRKVEDT